MEKIKITKKFVKNNFKNIIKVGYCDLQNMLKLETPRFYTCGTYGWNADIYYINYNTVIVTGYRPFGNITVGRDAINKYEAQANAIKSFDNNAKSKLLDLINKFVSEATK